MAEFRYTALDDQGREVTGALQAENRSAALARLKTMGMYPMGIEVAAGAAAAAAPHAAGSAASPAASSGGFLPRRVSPNDLTIFTRQLA
jgi:type IV pilus assembly protein PilC